MSASMLREVGSVTPIQCVRQLGNGVIVFNRGPTLCFLSENGMTKLKPLAEGQNIHGFKVHDDELILCWGGRTAAMVNSFHLNSNGALMSQHWILDILVMGKLLICLTAKAALEIYSSDACTNSKPSFSLLGVVHLLPSSLFYAGVIRLREGHLNVVGGCAMLNVGMWKLEIRELLRVLEGHKSTVLVEDRMPGSELMVLQLNSQMFKNVHAGSVFRVRLYEDLILSTSDDRCAALTCSVCGEILRRFKGHDARVWDAIILVGNEVHFKCPAHGACELGDLRVLTACEDGKVREFFKDSVDVKASHKPNNGARVLSEIALPVEGAVREGYISAVLSGGDDSELKIVSQPEVERTLGARFDGEWKVGEAPEYSKQVDSKSLRKDWVRDLQWCAGSLYWVSNFGKLYKDSKLLFAREGASNFMCLGLRKGDTDRLSQVFIGTSDGSVLCFDVATGRSVEFPAVVPRRVQKLIVGPSSVLAVSPTGDVRLIIEGGAVGSVSQLSLKKSVKVVSGAAFLLNPQERDFFILGDDDGSLLGLDSNLSVLFYKRMAHKKEKVFWVEVGPQRESGPVTVTSGGGDGCYVSWELSFSRDGVSLEKKKQNRVTGISQVGKLVGGHVGVGFRGADLVCVNLQSEAEIAKIFCGGSRRPFSIDLTSDNTKLNVAFGTPDGFESYTVSVCSPFDSLLQHANLGGHQGHVINALAVLEKPGHIARGAGAEKPPFFLSGSEENSIRLYDANCNVQQKLDEHVGAVRAIKVSKSGRYVVSGGARSQLVLYEVLWTEGIPSLRVLGCTELLPGSDDVRLMDILLVEKEEEEKVCSPPLKRGKPEVKVERDETVPRIVVCCSNGSVLALDALPSGEFTKYQELVSPTESKSAVLSACESRANMFFGLANGGAIKVSKSVFKDAVDSANAETMRKWRAHLYGCNDLKILNFGIDVEGKKEKIELLVSCGDDERICIFDPASLKCLKVLEKCHFSSIRKIELVEEWGPSASIASASWDKVLKMWKVSINENKLSQLGCVASSFPAEALEVHSVDLRKVEVGEPSSFSVGGGGRSLWVVGGKGIQAFSFEKVESD